MKGKDLCGRKLSVKLGERVQFKLRRNIIGFDKLRAAASLLLMGVKTAGNSGGRVFIRSRATGALEQQ